VSLSGIDADTYAEGVSASYAGTGSGCTTNCYGPSNGTAPLTVNPLGITGSFTADNKDYDGNNSATVLTRSLNGVLSPGGTRDDISLTGGTATFDNRNAGTGKTVTLTGASLTGGDSGNYSLTSVNTTTANIRAKALTITGLTAKDKVFDGNDSATSTGTPGLNGVVVINNVADDVSLTGTATGTFIDELVGNDKDVNVTGLSLAGADRTNYSLTPLVLHADITAWTTKGFY
jgi:trimeric autotransporter adhesin